MTALSIQPTYPIFTDIDGQPLEDGYVWIGVTNLAPIVNPITVYWDAALTIPAALPIRTRGGYPVNSGTPARLYVNSNYSIQVQNKNGSVVYSAPSATERYSDVVVSGINAEEVIYDPPFLGSVQTNAEDKFSLYVDAKDFGAVGDGVTDDTAAIQAAVNAARVVNFESLTYKIAGTVEIPDNTWLCGKPGTQFLGIMTPQGVPPGGYPNQMFRNADTVNGNENITFTNIKFNFAKGAYNYDVGPTLTSINSLKFVFVDNLTFEDCVFYDFVTNYNDTLTGKALLAFGMAQFDNCARVSFNRIITENIREEGFNFYECYQISFNQWRARGTAVNTSSHGAFWYCDIVSVRNAKFTHTGGSVLNCFSRNVLYENITVNENETQDGRGFDFGNELEARAFDIGNISVIGCTLNVTDYGIFLTNAAPGLNDLCESINVENNRIYVATGSAGVCYGIRFFDPKAAVIQNNFIYLSDVATAGEGRCVYLSLTENTSVNDYSVNYRIVGNYMRGLCGVDVTQAFNTSINGLYIQDNTWFSQNIGALSSSNGASVFAFFTNGGAAPPEFEISNVYIENNNLFNVGGGYLMTTWNDPADIRISNFNFCGNYVQGVTSNMDRGLVVDGGTSGLGERDFKFLNNTILNGYRITLNYLKYFKGEGNVFRWVNALAVDRLRVLNHNGTFEWINNRNYNTNTSYNDVANAGGNTFDIVNVTGNTSITTLGATIFQTDMPGNTTFVNSIIRGSVTYDPPNLADGAGVTTTVTVSSVAQLGDFAMASFSNDLQGITLTAWVSSAATVSVRFQNESGGAIDLASGTLSVRVIKQ